MQPTQSFWERIARPEPVCLDGAMNTELAANGFVFDSAEWLMANLGAPDALAGVHRDYAIAGAEVHIANSFAAARHALEPAGFGEHFESLNRAAVRLCREAIDDAASHPQWIAGSLSTFAPGHDRRNLPAPPALERNVAEQAEVLADSGCDLLALEMLFDAPASVAMLRGAATVGLPISIGLVCAHGPDGEPVVEGSRDCRRGMPDSPLTTTLAAILDRAPAGARLIVSIMHSEIEHTGPALAAVRSHWDGPTGAYPNRGRYAPPGGWDTAGACEPDAFVDACMTWIDAGANMVGGCCGVGPAHIRALGAQLRRHGQETIGGAGQDA